MNPNKKRLKYLTQNRKQKVLDLFKMAINQDSSP